jgi:hypothetical protein
MKIKPNITIWKKKDIPCLFGFEIENVNNEMN